MTVAGFCIRRRKKYFFITSLFSFTFIYVAKCLWENHLNSVLNLTGKDHHQSKYNLHLLSNVLEEPQISKSSAKFALIFVNSRADHGDSRNLIRETYASSKIREQLNITVVFLLAKTNATGSIANAIHDRIRREAAQFGDVILGDFFEDYHLITKKVLMGFRWLLENFREETFEYVIKTDDDMYINVFRLLEEIRAVAHQRKGPQLRQTIMCAALFEAKVPRDPTNKWYVSKTDWTPDVWPTFCPGSMYIMQTSLMRQMYRTVFRTKHMVWHEDVFLTGVVAGALNVSFVDFGRLYRDVENAGSLRDRGVAFSNNLVFAHIPSANVRRTLWNEAVRSEHVKLKAVDP